MASQSNSEEHKEPDKEAGSRDGKHPPPPASGMGYPPTMPYPQGQQGYPPYNGNAANGYNYNYPYAQAPPAAYYNSHMYPQQGPPPRFSTGFARGFLIGIILLVVFMCTSTILLWVILRPQIPAFKVASLSVTNFVASPVNFAATWEANVTVENDNTKLRAYFNKIKTFMFYDSDDLLAQSFAQPFFLETKTNAGLRAKLSANNSENPQVANWVVDELAQDRAKGTISFNLRMAIWATFKSGTWYTRETTFRVYCEDLNIVFEGNTGNGNLSIGNKDSECVVVA